MHSQHQLQFRHLTPTGDEVVSTFRMGEDTPIDAVVDKFFDFMSAVAGYDLREQPPLIILTPLDDSQMSLTFPPIVDRSLD